MIQLRVEDRGQYFFLDLYDQDPIKLTFNIESLLEVATTSEFTRQFRVPASNTNTEFFKTVFYVNGRDFDVTQIKKAAILIDGAEFRQGEIRLLKIYETRTYNKYDYEIVFLGSVKNLGTTLGNKTLGDLDISDLAHTVNYTNIVQSWQAYPEGALNGGLLNGDVLYPLVDFGNTYTNGTVDQTRIAVGSGVHFTNSSNPLTDDRFRPMIRAKTIIDKIFEATDYSYDSEFLDSDDFRHIYISAWGNNAVVDTGAQNNFNLARWPNPSDFNPYTATNANNPGPFVIQINEEDYDYGNNVEINPTLLTREYTAPILGQQYDWTCNVRYVLNWGYSGGQAGTDVWEITPMISTVDGTADPYPIYRFSYTRNTPGYLLTVEKNEGSGFVTQTPLQPIDVVDPIIGQETQVAWLFDEIIEKTVTPTTGLVIRPGELEYISGPNNVAFSGKPVITITAAPGTFNPAQLFEEDYKQLDFLKDIFKMFRLLLIPNPIDPSKFTIEPWQNYISSGEVKDWTQKLDLDKDITLTPLVLEQADRLVLTMKEEDKDYLNELNVDQFKETFGTLKLDTAYDMLEGETKVEVGMAPTPMTQINGYTANPAVWETVMIPQMCTNEFEDGIRVFKPVVPSTRILYYNGLIDSGTWYFEGNSQTKVPLVSYYSDWTPQPGSYNLNFQTENGYDQEDVWINGSGVDLYTRFWNQYVDLVYDKWTRRVTAYFILDQEDLLNFKYSDVIFVKGEYYYVEKIYDAPLDRKHRVKVDLITLNNYQVNTDDFIPPIDFNIWNEFAELWNTTTALWTD